MKQVSLFVLLVTSAFCLTAQSDVAVDPDAKLILDKFEQWVASVSATDVKFAIDISVPGQDNVTYDGSLLQSGESFKMIFGTYSIFSDSKTRWVYDSESNEVYLYDAKSSDGPSTPMEYITIYKQENFEYRKADEYAGAGEHCIEFKPTDKYSEYSKARITFNQKTHRPTRVELFEKGGVRTDMTITSIKETEAKAASFFMFDVSAYPDIHVEDLRID